MSVFLTVLWSIIKWAAIIGGSFALVVLLIVVFHPIYFTLKGRASVKGQRGEVMLSYLFNIVRIRYIASVHTQDVWLEIFKWRKLLQRETAHKTRTTATYEAADTNESVADESVVYEQQEPAVDKETASDGLETTPQDSQYSAEKEELATEAAESSEESEVAEQTQEPDSVTEEPVAEEASAENEAPIEEVTEQASEVAEPEYKVEATPEQLAELQNILEAEEKKEEAKKKSGDEWRDKLRKFKKDFNRRYDELRGKIRLVRQKWKSLWPVVKRFWNRGKKGFKFHDASLKIKYSLDEHHLTGMMCGYLAPTVGFAKQCGVNWEPVPVFPDKPGAGIYSKASWHIDIRPYMLVWAVIGLLFEKNLYKELYWLYKLKKGKKTKKAKE